MKNKNGLKEATAKLKAQGFKNGGEVKAEITKGFGAGRRT
jgi:hypothetical protein